MAKHKSENRYAGEGARGGCYFDIDYVSEGVANLRVGWSCVVVHQEDIPVSWLSELVAIATAHKDGIAGFLKEHENKIGGESYALMCDPVK